MNKHMAFLVLGALVAQMMALPQSSDKAQATKFEAALKEDIKPIVLKSFELGSASLAQEISAAFVNGSGTGAEGEESEAMRRLAKRGFWSGITGFFGKGAAREGGEKLAGTLASKADDVAASGAGKLASKADDVAASGVGKLASKADDAAASSTGKLASKADDAATGKLAANADELGDAGKAGKKPAADVEGGPKKTEGKPDADGNGSKPDADGNGSKPDADGNGSKPDADGNGSKPDADANGNPSGSSKPDGKPPADADGATQKGWSLKKKLIVAGGVTAVGSMVLSGEDGEELGPEELAQLQTQIQSSVETASTTALDDEEFQTSVIAAVSGQVVSDLGSTAAEFCEATSASYKTFNKNAGKKLDKLFEDPIDKVTNDVYTSIVDLNKQFEDHKDAVAEYVQSNFKAMRDYIINETQDSVLKPLKSQVCGGSTSKKATATEE